MTRRIALESLLLPFLLLIGTVRSAAQDRWDGILDQYESICDRCIAIRQRIALGASVPDSSVTALLQELASLRKTLQDASGVMTAAQRTRFQAIQKQYAAASGGVETAPVRQPRAERSQPKSPPAQAPPQAAPVEEIRVPRTSPDLPVISHPLRAAASPLHRLKPGLKRPEPVSQLPEYESTAKWSADLLLQYGHGAASSYGLMAGVGYGPHWGVWAAGRSNFTATGHSYDCRSDGQTDGGRFWGNGQDRYGVVSISGGPLWRPLPWLGIYAGAGYSKEELDWQDAEGRWARVTDYSVSGLCWDAGLLLRWKRLSLAAGCSWNAFATLTIGAGVHF